MLPDGMRSQAWLQRSSPASTEPTEPVSKCQIAPRFQRHRLRVVAGRMVRRGPIERNYQCRIRSAVTLNNAPPSAAATTSLPRSQPRSAPTVRSASFLTPSARSADSTRAARSSQSRKPPSLTQDSDLRLSEASDCPPEFYSCWQFEPLLDAIQSKTQVVT